MMQTAHRSDAPHAVHCADAPHAVHCEDGVNGCTECSRMKYDSIYRSDMPHCWKCGYRSGLRVVPRGYECYDGKHYWDD
jgi:hypothetical protein